MPIRHVNPATNDIEYSEGVGSGTSAADPHRGKSIIQNGSLVDQTNPLHSQDVELAGRIGGKSDAAATSDDATASLIALFKRGLQRWSAMVAALGATNDGAAASDTATASQIGLAKRALQHLAGILAGVGAPADAAAGSDGGTASLLALIKRGLGNLSTIVARLPASGVSTESTQATMSANVGSALDGEATGNGSVIAVLKRIRSLLDGVLSVRGRSRVWRVTPPLQVSVGYSLNTSLGGLIELPNAVSEAGRSVVLHSLQVTCRQSLGFVRIIIFDANPTASTVADGQVINIVPADDAKIAAVFTVDAGATIDGTSLSGNQSSASAMPKAVSPNGGTSLWMLVQQIDSTPRTFTGAADLKICQIGFDD